MISGRGLEVGSGGIGRSRKPSLSGANVAIGARAAGPITGPESPQADRSPDHRFSIQRWRPRAGNGPPASRREPSAIDPQSILGL